MKMKRILYLVLESGDNAFHTLEELKRDGYNATVVSTESLRHAVDYFPEEHHFFNLRQLEEKDLSESVLCLFVIDESQLGNIKSSIRRLTNNFLDVKGFMYSQEIGDYEGSI